VSVARYISTAERRRKALFLASLALVAGLATGFLLAKATTPSMEENIAAVQADVRETTGGLRVLALHAQAGVGGTADVQPVLAKTRSGLDAELDAAPWIGSTTRHSMLDQLGELSAMSPSSASFATTLTRVADDIDAAFGVSSGR
jgi:hypothetical protein